STAVGAVVCTPAPTVAWSGRERTSSLTEKLSIGPCTVAVVTVAPPCCCARAGVAAISASPLAIAVSICFVIFFSCDRDAGRDNRPPRNADGTGAFPPLPRRRLHQAEHLSSEPFIMAA